MPKLDTDMDIQHIGGSTYKFSAVRPEKLGATEYTLATVVLDRSGSVSNFRDEIEKALKASVEACGQSPRADNLLLRVVTFGDDVEEIHGFKPLPECHLDDYTGVPKIRGCTALYDATYTAIQATIQQGQTLSAADMDVNGIVIVVTDGCEYPTNNSRATRKMVKDAINQAVTSEALESLRPVLVGVNVQGTVNQQLDEFRTEAGFDQYVALSDANPKTLAKLAAFISKSISSQSQALGTGGASKALTF